MASVKRLRKKIEPVTSAAKAADGNKALIAALKRCATLKPDFVRSL
jgi:hypothetical protein